MPKGIHSIEMKGDARQGRGGAEIGRPYGSRHLEDSLAALASHLEMGRTAVRYDVQRERPLFMGLAKSLANDKLNFLRDVPLPAPLPLPEESITQRRKQRPFLSSHSSREGTNPFAILRVRDGRD